MATPYSQDLRDRVLAAYDRGERTGVIARMFQVSAAWARRVKQTRRETGRTTPLPMGGATVVKIDRAILAEMVKERPDATLRELREALGNICTDTAVCMALKAIGLSYKKRRSTRPSRIARTWPHDASAGRPGSPGVMPAGWSSSTSRAPRPT